MYALLSPALSSQAEGRAVIAREVGADLIALDCACFLRIDFGANAQGLEVPCLLWFGGASLNAV